MLVLRVPLDVAVLGLRAQLLEPILLAPTYPLFASKELALSPPNTIKLIITVLQWLHNLLK
jgi:hypothetical protein